MTPIYLHMATGSRNNSNEEPNLSAERVHYLSPALGMVALLEDEGSRLAVLPRPSQVY